MPSNDIITCFQFFSTVASTGFTLCQRELAELIEILCHQAVSKFSKVCTDVSLYLLLNQIRFPTLSWIHNEELNTHPSVESHNGHIIEPNLKFCLIVLTKILH